MLPAATEVYRNWSEIYPNSRPHVARGDWFRTCLGKRHCCRMYCLPGDGLIGDVARGTYIGPVHDVDVSEEFLAVLVPFPHFGVFSSVWNCWRSEDPELVWITVHCAHNLENDWNKPVSYAIKVTCVEFARWVRNGWANHFLDVEYF